MDVDDDGPAADGGACVPEPAAASAQSVSMDVLKGYLATIDQLQKEVRSLRLLNPSMRRRTTTSGAGAAHGGAAHASSSQHADAVPATPNVGHVGAHAFSPNSAPLSGLSGLAESPLEGGVGAGGEEGEEELDEQELFMLEAQHT